MAYSPLLRRDPGAGASTPKYPSRRAQKQARTVLAPAEVVSADGRVRSTSTAAQRAAFCGAAEAKLQEWFDGRTQSVQASATSPGFGQLDVPALDALYGLATAAVSQKYGDLLTNSAPAQNLLPRGNVQYITAGNQTLDLTCQRMFNFLRSEGVFADHGMLAPSNTESAHLCAGLVGGCSASSGKTCAAAHANDTEAASHVVQNFMCKNQAQLLQNAAWDPGYTETTNGARTVHVQDKFDAPTYAKASAAINQSAIDRERARRRWETLMTLVHETVHTLVHPRFDALINDSSKIADTGASGEGFTEFLALPAKQKLLDEVRRDPDGQFAQQVFGGRSTANKAVAGQATIKDKYTLEAKKIDELAGRLGKHGRANIERAYFRGWIEFIGFAADRGSRPLAGRRFVSGDLDSFLAAATAGPASRSPLADDRARAIVDDWRRGVDPARGTSRHRLTTAQKAALMRQLLQGWTGNPDERAILALLEHSTPEEWRVFFGGEEPLVDRRVLVRNFQWQRRRLAELIRAKVGLDLSEFKASGVA